MKTRQKAVDQLANRRGGRDRAVALPDGPVRRMALPQGITSVEAKRNWREFWKSDIARAVDGLIDRELLLRWIRAIDEREVLLADIERDGPMLATPRGRVLTPLYARVHHLDREINTCRVHLGLSPLARFRLLGTVGKAQAAAGKVEWSPPAGNTSGPASAPEEPKEEEPVEEY